MGERPSDQRVIDVATSLAQSGSVINAAEMLLSAVREGNAEAALTLGLWRVSGSYIRRDLALARELFGRAADLGSKEAEVIYIALLANGAGGSGRGWSTAVRRLEAMAGSDKAASVQLGLLHAMAVDQDGNPVHDLKCTRVRNDPDVQVMRGFLSAPECDYIVGRALPILRPSVVVHPVTQQFIQDPVRTSTAAGFPFVAEDPVLHAINRRIAAASSTTYEQGEPLQVLSYEVGQQYKLHSDALAPNLNQRVLTCLVYLNEDYEGGETFFPDLDFAFRGRPGDALLFSNVRPSGEPHPKARHSGRPVTRGRKLLLSKWIRAAPLDLQGPPGRPL